MSSKEKVSVLIIEDDPEDFFLTKEILHNIKNTSYKIDWESDYKKAIERVLLREHEVYLIDYKIGSKTGIDLVKVLVNSGVNCPFIFLTGMDNIDIDVEAMQVGATDYLIKGKINADLLERTIRYAIRQKKIENKLRESNTTKDKLFSVISHDLRSPLGSLMNALELMVEQKDKIDPVMQSQIIKELLKNSKLTYNLLENLLQWSLTHMGALTLKVEEIEACDILAHVMRINLPSARVKSIILECNDEPGLVCYADRNMLDTILRNLISNAIKYTPEMGKVTLDITKKGNAALFSVSDTGIGMDKETKQKILDPNVFYSSRGTNNEKGSGLGLILCKEFVQKLGGDIWIDSRKGKGSTFYFTIPDKPEQNT